MPRRDCKNSVEHNTQYRKHYESWIFWLVKKYRKITQAGVAVSGFWGGEIWACCSGTCAEELGSAAFGPPAPAVTGGESARTRPFVGLTLDISGTRPGWEESGVFGLSGFGFTISWLKFAVRVCVAKVCSGSCVGIFCICGFSCATGTSLALWCLGGTSLAAPETSKIFISDLVGGFELGGRTISSCLGSGGLCGGLEVGTAFFSAFRRAPSGARKASLRSGARAVTVPLAAEGASNIATSASTECPSVLVLHTSKPIEVVVRIPYYIILSHIITLSYLSGNLDQPSRCKQHSPEVPNQFNSSMWQGGAMKNAISISNWFWVCWPLVPMFRMHTILGSPTYVTRFQFPYWKALTFGSDKLLWNCRWCHSETSMCWLDYLGLWHLRHLLPCPIWLLPRTSPLANWLPMCWRSLMSDRGSATWLFGKILAWSIRLTSPKEIEHWHVWHATQHHTA